MELLTSNRPIMAKVHITGLYIIDDDGERVFAGLFDSGNRGHHLDHAQRQDAAEPAWRRQFVDRRTALTTYGFEFEMKETAWSVRWPTPPARCHEQQQPGSPNRRPSSRAPNTARPGTRRTDRSRRH